MPIFTTFGWRFVLSNLAYGDFIEQAADPAMEQVYRGGQAVVYKIVLPSSTKELLI